MKNSMLIIGRTAEIRLTELEYRRSLTHFDDEFKQIMDAQTHIFGADSVAEKWATMKAAYNKFVNGE